MTAEVALLNKHAVALAADSAVTVSGARGNKIYNAANKLFALSKYEPIGIMIYGSAEYMGVPWETIVKIFRQQLGSTALPRVEDYYRRLLDFLGTNDSLFGDHAQASHVLDVAVGVLVQIRERIRTKVDAQAKGDNPVGEGGLAKLVTTTIKEILAPLTSAPFATSMDEDHESIVRSATDSFIDAGIDRLLQKLPLSAADRIAIHDIIVYSLTRDRFDSGSTGIVVAGFGTDEHFPALYNATVQARVAGRLKFRDDAEPSIISNDNGAEVVPFAQTDAVSLFIEGIDPAHSRYATRSALSTLRSLRDDLVNKFVPDGDSKDALIAETDVMVNDRWRAFSEDAKASRQEKYIDPLISVIEMLPKDELAAAAEALVNLTSLRRKMSMDAETVGGPIDVAVISKGDGLIWIKRKHYFKADLNSHFAANYFRVPPPGGIDAENQ